MSEIEDALAIGEVVWALRVSSQAIRAAKKATDAVLLDALRLHAAIELAYVDDTDMPSTARVAAAWRKVSVATGATAADFAMLAWAELLAFKPKKAEAAFEQAGASSKVLEAAVAWTAKRKDTKRLASLVDGAMKTIDEEQRALAARLLAQAYQCPIALADRLRQSTLPCWDPAVARRVALCVGVYRGAGEKERADAIATDWARACDRALPNPKDPRRHVLDDAKTSLDGVRRRVERATSRYGATHPALEMPLRLLASQARHEENHDLAIEALERVEPILRAKQKTEDDRIDLHLALGDLRKSLVALRRFDEAFVVLEREEAVKARRALHMVPDHQARASIYEGRGDMGRAIEEYLAAVAQYEAGAPPAYGPKASNTESMRATARRALERAGRGKEARRLFPP
ncbi:hypothetical protein BH09MYX1_BH09MYX1_01970 [soil metagenome]